MKAKRREFVVERGHLPASPKEPEPIVVVVDKGELAEKKRERRLRGFVQQAFRSWKPGF